MRKALVIGINEYGTRSLKGCVNDALRIHTLLWRHQNDELNFHSRIWTAPAVNVAMAKGPPLPPSINQSSLRRVLEEFFADRHCELALVYFAGHGALNKLGGYLVTQDAQSYNQGLSMSDLLTLAHQSSIPEIIFILDCCHSGAFGNDRVAEGVVTLRDGITVLSACGPTEFSLEENHRGVFTSLLCDGLDGGAADIQGKVTVASLYAYADEALGAFQQRPFFKASVSRLPTLRRCAPGVPIEILRYLPEYFETASSEYPLDPSYEPDAGMDNLEHQRIFRYLQTLRDAHLLVPVGEPHLFYAAMRSKACKLTPLGRSYWRLAKERML